MRGITLGATVASLTDERLSQSEDVDFLLHRVATLERDVMKLQGMWDMNKGQRVIEVWMSLLNKKTYKPSNM